jgi:hypothetical protein
MIDPSITNFIKFLKTFYRLKLIIVISYHDIYDIKNVLKMELNKKKLLMVKNIIYANTNLLLNN